jgi:hypothetical protein
MAGKAVDAEVLPDGKVKAGTEDKAAKKDDKKE